MRPVYVLLSVLAISAGALKAAVTDHFSENTGLWTYTGTAHRDPIEEHVVLTDASYGAWGQIWLNEPRTAPFAVSFRYRAGGGLVGGDGLVFMFQKSKDYSPTFPDYGGSLGFSRSPHASLAPVPGYGVEFDSVHNLAIYNDPSPNHIALIQDHAGNHLASIDDSRVADDRWHLVQVQVGLDFVEVAVDGQTVISWSGAIDTEHGGIGFSAATGSYTNRHLIDDFSLTDLPTKQVLDNGEPGTSSVGYWQISGALNPYGKDSLYARGGASYTYRQPLPAAGRYDVAAWWTSFPSRSTSVPIVVEHADGNSMIYVDQMRNGGTWNVLGTFNFGTTATVRIVALGAATTCADAVAFLPKDVPPLPQEPPEIILDDGGPGTSSIGTWAASGAPSPHGGRSLYSKQAGATYTYSTKIDEPGAYEVHVWWTQLPSRSSEVPIEIRHADGTSTILANQLLGGGRWNLVGRFSFSTFAVVEITSMGTLSTCADAVRFVGVGVPPPPPPTGFVVVDNGTPGTSAAGTWLVSSALDPHEADSLYSKSLGSYSFSASATGAFNVYAWWTQWPSRSRSVPITIQHAGGTTTVRVDQTLNGGQWNLLGKFALEGLTVVTVVSEGGGFSTCADAIRLQP